MIKYIIYTQNNCEYCDKAKKRLDKEKAHVEERLLDTTEKIKRFKKAGYNTVPQIFLHILIQAFLSSKSSMYKYLIIALLFYMFYFYNVFTSINCFPFVNRFLKESTIF